MAKTKLKRLQEKLLDRMLRVLFLISLAVFFIILAEDLSAGTLDRILYFYAPILLTLAAIAFIRKIPLAFRFHALLVLINLLAVIELIYWGFSSLAFFFFLTASVTATLLSSPRTGWISFLISLLILFTAMFLYSRQLIPVESRDQLKALRLRNWFGPLSAYIMMQITLLLISRTIISFLVRSINEVERKREQLKKEKAALEKAAFIDPVTGLPNNRKIIRDIGTLMAEKEDRSYKIDQILVELLDFGDINIKYGLETGNYMLNIIASRLQTLKPCTVYRMTGPSFLIHCAENHGRLRYSDIEKIIGEPIPIDNQIIPVKFKASHIRYPDDISNPTLMLPNLMLAVNNSAKGPTNRIKKYNDTLNKQFVRHSKLREQLENALAKEEIDIYIQPRMEAVSGRIIGGELLMRWNNVDFGSVPPTEFIPISEKDELIFELSHYLMQFTLNMDRFFDTNLAGSEKLLLSVNISPHIIQSGRLDEFMAYAELQKGNIHYEFELTEGVFLGISEKIRDELESLKSRNISVSIDDFGTGYSNLEYLQDLNVNILKIDKKFIDGLPHSDRQRHLVKAVIQMAGALGLKTVAEGVEYREQLSWLREHGIDEIQGFALAEPMKLDQFASFFQAHKEENWRI